MNEKNVANILIRRVEPDDIRGFERIREPPGAAWGTLSWPAPPAQLWRQRLARRTAGQHGLVACAEAEIVGGVRLVVPERSPSGRHVGRVGIGVHDGWQGRGIGTALLQAAVDLADRWLNLRRLELTVSADNESALRLYRNWGFEIEGLLPNHAFRDGRFVDAYTMARVR
jgi:putative acetyltransferase